MPEDELEKKRFKDEIRSKDLICRAQPRLDLIDEENSIIPFVIISKDNATERFDWWNDEVYIEELDVNGADMSELRTFFKDHNVSVDTASGAIKNKRIENGQALVDVHFGSDEASQLLKQKYIEEILIYVSVGYRIDDFVETVKKDEPNHILVTSYRIHELSAVWKGADSGAVVGRSREKTEVVLETPARNIRELQLKTRRVTV